MRFFKIISLVFLFMVNSSFTTGSEFHDVHESKCSIDFSNEEKTLQITIHIYLDDLEAAIAKRGVKETLHLCTEKEHADGDKHVYDYLQKTFNLEVNDKAVNYNYLGKEISEDLLAGWFYVEVEDVQILEKLKIDYGILTDLYDDQRSILKVKGPNKKKGYFLLDSKKTEAIAQF